MNSRWVVVFILAFSSFLELSFFSAHAEDVKPDAKPKAKQRLQMEEGLKLEDYSTPAKTIEDTLRKQKETPAIQYDLKQILKETTPLRAAVGNTQRTIAEIRASALKNNLDLQIVQADPKIAQTRVDEERAKFDNII